MDNPKKEIVLPTSGLKLEIKTWITGRQSEYIQEPLFEAIEMNARVGGEIDMGKMQLSKVIESNHREISCFVVSFNGEDKDVLNKVLELPESDYQFVLDKIKEQRKKK